MSEGVQKVRPADLERQLARCLIAALGVGIGGLVSLDAGFVAAESVRTLTGAQIRAAFTGKQLTDEVHYRFVYDGDGTLRTYSMGAKQVGTWRVEKNELCLFLKDMEDSCYSVTKSGRRFELKPTGLGSPLDGILEPAFNGDGTK
ncbi:hypothetical protein [Bradyrhizobium guangxiense]|uniref:hypothetical protein n=1 Tax=Bradyrhizobium guangxiense TaxID=1325115 RepID=UPI0013E8CBF1|nr:hypothetical protein [Bradyrhizobium guangxiense]